MRVLLMIKNSIFIILVTIGLGFSSGVYADKSNDIIRIGFLPYIQPSLLLKKYTPLAKHLTQKLKVPVKIHIAKNYEEQILNLTDGKIDIAFLGAAVYVKRAEAMEKPPRIIARYEMNGKPSFSGVIIVKKESDINKISDLKGKSMAFGDARSTLSHLVPRDMLLLEGLNVEKLSRHGFLGSHDNVIMNVLFGEYDAGGIADEVFEKYKDKPIRILATSTPISPHVFVAADHMKDVMFNKIRDELINLKSSVNGKKVIDSIGLPVTGFVVGVDEDYDGVRKVFSRLRKAGIEP
jgi:phosphonate transport system substrate-binding protein